MARRVQIVSLLFDRIIVYYVRSYLCQNYDMYTLTLSFTYYKYNFTSLYWYDCMKKML